MISFLIIILLGLFFRFLFIGNPGFIADISFWKSWGLAALDHGVVWTAHNTNINYPPGFIYVLWLMGFLYSLFADPHNFNQFWRENNFLFLLVSKSIAVISDLFIAMLIYWFFSQKKHLEKLGGFIPEKVNIFGLRVKTALMLSAIFLFHPVVIIDSALWGQVESFGILFTLVSLVLLFYQKPLPAALIFTIGPLMKLQNIIFIPLFFLYIFRRYNLQTTFKCLAVSFATFIMVILPFIIAADVNQVLYLLTVNSDYFPWLSLNAHNIWWIKAAGQGMKITDRITVLGILNAKTIGLLLFSASYLLSCLLLFLKPTARNFLLSLTFAIFSFFLLTTQSHERYSYPVVVLLLFLYPFLKNQFSIFKSKFSMNFHSKNFQTKNSGLNKNFKFQILNFNIYFWLLYLLFSISIFFNIHTGLILNYPDNGIFSLTRITTPWLTIFNSYLSIILFFLLLPLIFSQISRLYFFLCLGLLILAITALHASYLFSGKVSLTSLKPIIIKQDFGVLQTNKSVDSASGWKKWNRLSDNYFFYRKGFGTHANSNLVFDINRKFSRFSTDFGIDTEAPTAASVVFEIYTDGNKVFESSKMGRFDFPSHVEIDVKGVKHLDLRVTDAGDGINSDHADWLNPVLYR